MRKWEQTAYLCVSVWMDDLPLASGKHIPEIVLKGELSVAVPLSDIVSALLGKCGGRGMRESCKREGWLNLSTRIEACSFVSNAACLMSASNPSHC